MKTVIVAIILLLTSSVFAGEIKYPAVIATNDANSTVLFTQCFDSSSCFIVGDYQGYPLSKLNFKVTRNKFITAGITVAEIAAGYFASFFGVQSLLNLSDAYYISTGGMFGICMGAWAGFTTLPWLVDDLNPIKRTRAARVQKKFLMKSFEINNRIVVEFENDAEMIKFIKTLKNVLTEL